VASVAEAKAAIDAALAHVTTRTPPAPVPPGNHRPDSDADVPTGAR
jgi:hypothetical protein